MRSETTHPRRTAAPAWRGGFGRLWSAAVVSRFGDALRGAALPLLAVELTDSALLVALVTACGFLPWLLFGLIGGAVADRVDQRRAMWITDVLRGLLMAAFAFAVWQDRAGIALLLVLAFALTALQTVFDNAATALLPAVVPTAALGTANGRLLAGQEAVHRFAGTPLVPVLVGAGAAVPYAVDAASYLLAAVLVAGLPHRPGPGAGRPRTPLRRDVADGLRALWGDPVLRGVCAATVVANTGFGALVATLVLHLTGWLGAGTTGYALALTAYGIGSVTGGMAAGRVSAALGAPRTLVWAGLAQAACLTAFGTARSLPAAGAALAVLGFAGMLWTATEITVLQRRSPAGAIGRTSAAFRTLSISVVPLGAVLGGVLAGSLGENTPALAAAVLTGLGVVALGPAARSGIN
ncbi:MFS transporter [Streptomyces sp. CMB-StM0423]|uniref:MFS transporter n=1 Tax=Streptomyces sp. CMB-StM0423 TaxID=2059884 RepID=UPI000C70A3ED|nr:MFS transporter [Streptomyces sp. CMB-StM0423]AUH43654.1 MFS transporter [Streptomyces sp. CMB-StM0423]